MGSSRSRTVGSRTGEGEQMTSMMMRVVAYTFVKNIEPIYDSVMK